MSTRFRLQIGLCFLTLIYSFNPAAGSGKKFEKSISCTSTLESAIKVAEELSEDVRVSRTEFPLTLYVAIDDYHFYLGFIDERTLKNMYRFKTNMIVREEKNKRLRC